MNVLIADDEAPARERLRHLLDAIGPPYTTIGEAENGVEVLHLCTETKPDLVLLDIRMPVMDGIEAAQALTRLDAPPAVIFVTAYDQHALQAFDANAIDYLLKPIRQIRLEQALEKVSLFSQARRQQQLQRSLPRIEQQPRTHICATAGGKLQVIPVAQVRYCRADQKYVAMRTQRQELLINESLKALEREFPERFVRVHRNALVAIAYLEALEKAPNGRPHVKLQGIDESVEVSRRHVSSLRAVLKRGVAARAAVRE
ncbi:MAG TPA: response regulator transcription factor [Chromatiaceae bacterium]|nr:response regulator transcription factor [Chromatiaceae bacterium]